MPVSGIVLGCADGCAEVIVARLAAVSGIEVHDVLPDGRIVAVVEADTIDGEVALVSGLQEIDGVVSVQLAYHNFEDSEPERP